MPQALRSSELCLVNGHFNPGLYEKRSRNFPSLRYFAVALPGSLALGREIQAGLWSPNHNLRVRDKVKRAEDVHLAEGAEVGIGSPSLGVEVCSL